MSVAVTRLRFKPLSLEDAPEVDRFLAELGLGGFERARVAALPGRNDTWAGPTTSGRAVFVKRLTGPAEEVRARMRRVMAFERCVANAGPEVLRGPHMLGADEGAGLLAFEYLEDARSGAELMVDQHFTNDLCHAVGHALGSLHATTPTAADLETDPPALPSPLPFEGIPLAAFEQSTNAELEAWRLFQGDDALRDAVSRLREAEDAATRTPCHCDFRLDQLLLEPDGASFVVADWEEFRMSDAARDIGGFVGEWLYRAVLDIVTSRGDADAAVFEDLTLTRETLVRRGAEKLARLRPFVQAFWAGYLQARPADDPDLAWRSTAFAGWHTIDRLLAGASRSSRLLGIERAAAGVGRTALLDPRRFTAAVGLGGGS